MTPICSEHAALLKRIAKNLNDRTARGVYADWLQERGEPAWYVVANYPPALWVHRLATGKKCRPAGMTYAYSLEVVAQLPWLEGSVFIEGNTEPVRTKRVLLDYAEGKAK